MRLFAVGDIHGCGTAFEVLLAAIDLGPNDKLVALGDYLNKGPETKLVFDQLIPLADKGIVIPLVGNHELKMMAARRIGQPQLENNVLIDQKTLVSYGSDDEEGRFEDIPEKHWQFVEYSCLNWFTTEDYIFVHATLDADKPLVKQPRSALFWDKFRHPRPHCSGKTVVCGHTPQRDGTPVNLGHAICLDTAACEGHWLTCLEMNSGEVWQTNQQRQVRRSNIRDYFFGNQATADGSAYEHQLSVAR